MRLERDLLAGGSVRVTPPVRALVVSHDPAPDVLEVPAAEDVAADLGMAPHLLPLLFVQRAGLPKDGVGEADHADVVEPAGDLHPAHVPRPEAELAREHSRIAAHRLGVVGRARVAQVDRVGQAEQILQNAPRGRLHRHRSR
jgi:hypothetical protein